MPQHIVATVSVPRAVARAGELVNTLLSPRNSRSAECLVAWPAAGTIGFGRQVRRACRRVIDITLLPCAQSQYRLFSPCFGEIVRKKSEQLVSGGCLREILRFLDVARTRAGFSKAWNIKDFRLLTVLGDSDRFLKNRGKVPWGRDIQTFFSISRWNRSHRRDIEIPPGGHMAGIAAVHKPTTCRAQCNLALRAKARVSVRQTSAEYRVTSSDETT